MRIGVGIVVALSLSTQAFAGWYATGGTWTARKKIVVDHTKVSGSASLPSFPVLISVTDDDLRLSGQGGFVRSASGDDLVFTAIDGTTRLTHEVESYNPATGVLVAWVNLPQLSTSSDTPLYMYFGGPNASNKANASNVWDSNYLAVYHLGDSKGATLLDSTSNRVDLKRSDQGRPAQALGDGAIGNSQVFDAGHAAYARIPSDDRRLAPITLSLWVHRAEDYNAKNSHGIVTSSDSGFGGIEFGSTPDANTITAIVDGTARVIATKVDTQWNHVAFVRSGTSFKMYWNGVLAQSFTIATNAAIAFDALGDLRGLQSLAGQIDEVRWSQTNRPSEWIATEYANQHSPATFFSLGTLETATPTSVSGAAQLFQIGADVASSIQGVEDVSKRTANSRHFRQTNGSWTAIITPNLNQSDGKGGFVPVVAALSQDGNGGWAVQAGALGVALSQTSKGHDLKHRYIGSDGKTHSLTVSFPVLIYLGDANFQFTQAGLLWRVATGPTRSAFSARVTTTRGVQTYSFDFDPGTAKASVDTDGDVVLDDGARLSAAVMVRNDGVRTACRGWSIKGKTASMTCDDSAFPKTAFPYVIDPVITPPANDLQSCMYWSSNNQMGLCTPGSFKANTDLRHGESSYFLATWTMDTSSVPVNATINSVLVSMITDGFGGTYTVLGANGIQMATCGPTFGYYGEECDNVLAPISSITRGATSSFQGTCPDCDGFQQDPPPPYYAHSASLTSFSLTVNYVTQSPITVTTSLSGRAFSVDGVSYSSAQTFQWGPGSTHTIAIPTSPQSGSTGTQYVYNGWSDGGGQTHAITVGAGAATYSANFMTQYYLTTSASPTAGGSISPSSGWYNAGMGVSVIASTNGGYSFNGFIGALSGTTTPQALTMSGPQSVTATFSTALTTVTTSPTGRAFTVDGSNFSSAQTFQWVAGSTHTIAVAISPQAGTSGIQYLYTSWSDSGSQSHSIVAPSSSAIYTATFTPQYLLTTLASPANGGTISPSANWYNANQSVAVSASAAVGYLFSNFTGGLTGVTTPQTIVMTGATTVTATFTQIQPLTATCSASTTPSPATVGQLVTFSAALAGGVAPYSYLWSGAASGTNPTASATPSASGTLSEVLTVRDSASHTISTSCAVSVSSGDFSLTSPGTVTLIQGQSGQPGISINPISNFNSPVTFAWTYQPAWPQGLVASFSPSTSTTGTVVSLYPTYNSGYGTPPGTYTLSFTASGGGVLHSGAVVLKVVPKLVAWCSPSSQPAVAGTPVTFKAYGYGDGPYAFTNWLDIVPNADSSTATFTPATANTLYTFWVYVSDARNQSVKASCAVSTSNGSADFSVNSPTVPVEAGQSVSASLSITGLAGFSLSQRAVTITLTSVPAGLTPDKTTFTTNGVSPSFIFQTSSTLAPGVYPIPFTATDGTLPVHYGAITLNVSAPLNFSIAISPATQTTIPGGVAFYTVTASGTVTGDITLQSPTNLVANSTASYDSTVLHGPGATTLRIQTNSSTPLTPTPQQFTVIATAAGLGPQPATATLKIDSIGITTTSLQNAVTSVMYQKTLTVSGGTSPYNWSITSGALPAGLSLSSSGVLSGTPSATPATYSFTVSVSDSTQPIALTASQPLSITVIPQPIISTTSLGAGTVGQTYQATLSVVGGTPGYVWTTTAGTLPAGLSINSSGVISGTPTSDGTSSFTVTVTDSTLPTPLSATQSLSIVIAAGQTSREFIRLGGRIVAIETK